MFACPRWLLPLSLLVCVSACKGADPIQEVCELVLTCPCSAQPYATADDCVAGLKQQSDTLKSFASSQGLTFDQGCYESSLALIQDEVGCGAGFTDESNASCSSYCGVIHGDKPAGAACTSTGGFSDCARNLFCADAVCVDFCARLGAGDVCAKTEGDTTSTIGSCGEGLYCDLSDTLTCKALLASGAACDQLFDNCQEGLVCGMDAMCGPPPGAGEACTFACSGDLICENSVCAKAPGDSEPCSMNGECAEGFECGDLNSCVPREPLLCLAVGSNDF